MTVYDINIMKQFVLENFPSGSPLWEIILQDEGGDISLDVLLAKGRIWWQLLKLENHIDYKIKDQYKHLYR